MDEEEKHSLLQPLIPFSNPSTSTTHNNFNYQHIHHNNNVNDPSNNNIIFRILLVLSVATISIWANYEASKTFDIFIVNDIKDTLAGHRFDLSYVSNDKATRIVLNTSSFVEHLLYPNNNNNQGYHKKHIDTLTLRLSRRNLNTTATVTAVDESFKRYVIDISPKLLEDRNYDKIAILRAVQRAMARVWLWDGGSRAPPGLVDGVAEYITELAGFRRESVSGGGELPELCEGWWWEDEDPTHVARYLHYCEKYKKGFIQRLNEAMRDTWHDQMVDDVLGMSVMKVCGLYNVSWMNLI